MSLSVFEQICRQQGVLLLGVLPTALSKEYPRFLKWLQQGYHGQMKFLEKYASIREDPSSLEPSMQSMIICAYPYGEKSQTSLYHRSAQSISPKVALYARLKDYHRELRVLGANIMEEYCLSCLPDKQYSYRVVVDSAPIMEKALASTTGAGFQGKNTLFIHPKYGSLLFLFEIFTSESFPIVSSYAKDQLSTPASTTYSCGSCRRCQVHCPTQALDQDYVLDARRCLAYYSIEYRSLIPVRYWTYFAQYIFGCDICQLVCPYNRWAQASSQIKHIIPKNLPLAQVALMNQQEYVRIFAGSAMTRAKRSGLRRNALISMVATQHPDLSHVLEKMRQEVAFTADLLLIGTMRQIPAFYVWRNKVDPICRSSFTEK